MPPARRILFLHPDAYGDLFLFEPVPRIIRNAWPEAEVAVLIRKPYADAIPLFSSDGVRWLTTDCNPYRERPGDHPAALAALRDTVLAFAPDCVVAACAEQTWLEAAVATFLPAARQVSLGRGLTDPLTRADLETVVPVDWGAIYSERVPVEPELPEWAKNLRLAGTLLGVDAPRWWPVARVPDTARAQAAQIIAGADLSPGEFAVCAAAGTTNVQIKAWPVERFGEILAWLERDRGVRALLVGHVSEREHLEAVQRATQRHGGKPALWLGANGEMPVVAGLLDAARFYFGNDTGALHLAAALGRPVVPIFGGGHWPRFQTLAARSVTVVQPLPCFGCAWDCYFVDAPCVRTISPASVRQALERILDDPAEGQVILEADGLEAGARELIDKAAPRLRFLREDSTDRLRQVMELTVQTGDLNRRLQASDTDRTARQRQVRELTTLLDFTEADRAARLTQIDELSALLQTSEADRNARLKQIEELSAKLVISDADRNARYDQIQELTALLQTSETDRAARLKQMEVLASLLRAGGTESAPRIVPTADADAHARANQVESGIPKEPA